MSASNSNLNYIQNSQLEILHSRYNGTGHPDITKHEWITNQHRDTISSIIGHSHLSSYVSIADGQANAKTKANLFGSMLQPCGPPPFKSD